MYFTSYYCKENQILTLTERLTLTATFAHFLYINPVHLEEVWRSLLFMFPHNSLENTTNRVII